jgi:hypothetical protein
MILTIVKWIETVTIVMPSVVTKIDGINSKRGKAGGGKLNENVEF